MNLNGQPTIDQLAQLFASCKDSHDNHILWISESGEVNLSPCADESEFGKTHPQMRARLKMYRRGQGYIGKKAAADKDFVGRVLHTLQQEFSHLPAKAEVQVVDRYC